jgi:hypothetical protein
MTDPWLGESNVRATHYFIAVSHVRCAHCDQLTCVLALALPPEHETRDLDAARGEDWQAAGVSAFVFFVTNLPDAVRSRLQRLCANFRPQPNEAAITDCWVNHCEHCDASMDDQELHCEPGVFMPCSEAQAAAVQLWSIDEAFEAYAAGYAPDPTFFALMRVG